MFISSFYCYLNYDNKYQTNNRSLYQDFNVAPAILIDISEVYLNNIDNYYITDVKNYGAGILPFPLIALSQDKIYDTTNIANQRQYSSHHLILSYHS